MKTSILDLIIVGVLSLILYTLFLKFFIIGFYKKYKYDFKNRSAFIYVAGINILLIVLFMAIIYSIMDSYTIMKMNLTNDTSLFLSFTPLVGKFLLLMLIGYFFILFLSRYIFKILVVKEGIKNTIQEDDKVGSLFFLMILLTMTVFIFPFISAIAKELIPLSNSIF